MPYKVIIAVASLDHGGRAVLAERLVRGLADRVDARILLMESDRSSHNPEGEASAPAALKCDRLPVGPSDTWGQRWEALERYLEEQAPCVYVMMDDWRYNVVAPRLSRNVKLIGLVDSGSTLGIEQAARLGDCWDAIVVANEATREKLASRFPRLVPRMVAMPETIENDESMEATVKGYSALIERLMERNADGGFIRQRGPIVAPPRSVAGVEIAPRSFREDVKHANKLVPWPDGPLVGKTAQTPDPPWSGRLEDCKVIVAASAKSITGVDVFAHHLVRGLRERGIDARLHGPAPEAETDPLAPPTDLPLEVRHPGSVGDFLTWPERWRLSLEQIERLAPCIYVPDYNTGDSCICPQLSGRVRVVGIGHSDDPWHYESLCRIGHACDAIVGVSNAITEHLRAIAPEFSAKLHTVPYGIPLPLEPWEDIRAAQGTRRPEDPLRVIFTGRLVQSQKRASDLVSIARSLDQRGVPFELVIVGDGEIRGSMEQAATDLIAAGKLSFKGTLSNPEVVRLLSSCDAYLLPSAFEGLSVGMLEAMSRGVLPVVSDIRSGVPDAIVPGQNGLIAPVGDVELFADRLEWLWRNPDERLKMSAAAARTAADHFSLERMIEDYIEIFSLLVAEPSRRSFGPIIPPPEIALWMTWPRRILSVLRDPLASARRVSQRMLYMAKPCGRR